MKEVTTAPRKHLLVKKSDAESNFYYMGTFDILDVKEDQKEDNKGILKKICKVVVKMHHPVRDDLLCYLQRQLRRIRNENNKSSCSGYSKKTQWQQTNFCNAKRLW